MPHYIYECDAGHEFEAEQSIKDDALTECWYRVGWDEASLSDVYCDAPCRRLIAGCSFVLKGSGWTGKGGK